MNSTKRAEEITTAKLPRKPGSIEPGATREGKSDNPASSLVEVDLAAQSHPGSVRSVNEDHYLALRVERSLHVELSNLPEGVLPDTACRALIDAALRNRGQDNITVVLARYRFPQAAL